MKSYVYAILDEQSESVKIGKANNIVTRMSELQVGNPNQLKLIAYTSCVNAQHAHIVERRIHKKFADLRGMGEWFKYSDDILLEFGEQENISTRKKIRDPLIVKSLWEEENISYGIDMFPSCFFYPDQPAQIKHSYENAIKVKKLSSQWRTMSYPTDGKPMLKMPDGRLLSDEVDRVFISAKKHQENLKLKKFQEKDPLSTDGLGKFYE